MAPTPDEFSSPGSVSYDSETMSVGDGTWDFSKNTFLLPNLQGTNLETTRYNGTVHPQIRLLESAPKLTSTVSQAWATDSRP